MKQLLNTLYVTTPQSFLRLENGNVVITNDDKPTARIPLHLIDGMVLYGCLGITPALMGECVNRGVRISFLGMHGNYLARVEGKPEGNVLLRREQYRVADSNRLSVNYAKRFITAKIRNQRLVLMRFHRDYPDFDSARVETAIVALENLQESVQSAEHRDELMGIEGKAADYYFGVFGSMVRGEEGMVFTGRSRRPPRDEVNALLSFFYTLLAHDVASACNEVGLDPYVGFLHTDRPGRTSMALDLMEELRPHFVDRFVLSMINLKQVKKKDFSGNSTSGFALTDGARKNVLGLWQKRKQDEITHPFLKEKVPIGLLPSIQARLLSKAIRGDIDDYPAFVGR